MYGAHPPVPLDALALTLTLVDALVLPAPPLPPPPPPELDELPVVDPLVDPLDVADWLLDEDWLLDVVVPELVDDPVGGSSTPAAQDIVAIERRSGAAKRIEITIPDHRK